MEMTIGKVIEAKRKMKNVVRETPLFYSSTFSRQSGCEVYLKCENKQKTGSFKLRGAYNKIINLKANEKENGVIASSAGNHAQGVAYAASAFGIKSTIVMPATAPQAKVQATRGYGAEVVQYGEVYDECYNKALELQKQTGAVFIHPFDDLEVIAGQGTIALEILEADPDIDAIVVPVGGGGLISGVAFAAKAIKPSIKVIGVQAAIIASTKASIEKGEIVTLPGIKSIADGISVSTPGSTTFELIQKYVDEVVTVNEDEISSAIFALMETGKMVSEGAGACPVAALLSKKIKLPGKKVAAVISGGNIDIEMVANIINRQLILLRRRIRFWVKIQDRVGELGKLITNIGELGGNIVNVAQEKNWDEKGLEYAKVTFEIEAQTSEHSKKIVEALIHEGYDIKNL